MTRTQLSTVENHVWQQLIEHKLSPENGQLLLELEHTPRAYAEILPHLAPGEYIVVAEMKSSEKNTSYFQHFLANLRIHGIDVGRGESIYGFKMPLPEDGQTRRVLRIFRRH